MHSIFLLLILGFLTMLSAVELKPSQPYTVSEINGVKIEKVDGLQFPTMTLNIKDMTVSGTSGINRYGGGYTLKDGTITVSQPFSTMMAGPEGAMKIEQLFLRLLSVPLKIEESKTGILLTGANGSMLLVDK
jgi:heat shock protein HslJ